MSKHIVIMRGFDTFLKNSDRVSRQVNVENNESS